MSFVNGLLRPGRRCRFTAGSPRRQSSLSSRCSLSSAAFHHRRPFLKLSIWSLHASCWRKRKATYSSGHYREQRIGRTPKSAQNKASVGSQASWKGVGSCQARRSSREPTFQSVRHSTNCSIFQTLEPWLEYDSVSWIMRSTALQTEGGERGIDQRR